MNNYKHELISINQDLGVNFYESIDKGSFVTKHWHYNLEVIYILDGSLDISINNKNFSLSEDDLIIINPKEIHSTICHDNNKAIVLQIPYKLLEENIPRVDSIFLKYNPYPDNNIDIENLAHIKSLLKNLFDVYSSKSNGYLLKSKSILFDFLFNICNYYAIENSTFSYKNTDKYFDRLKVITDYIKENYNQPISLTTVSDLVNLNPEYISRFFKKYMGMTFTSYVNNVRLEHIYIELLNTDTPIQTVIQNNGLYNYKQFMKLFKSVYNCTPSEKRKQLQSSKK